MNPTSGTIEDRVREHAYHLWEANGRPAGRDLEFWGQALELLTVETRPIAESAPNMSAQPPASPSTKAAKRTGRPPADSTAATKPAGRRPATSRRKS